MKKELAIISDLHTEFGYPFLHDIPEDVVIVNAGDTHTSTFVKDTHATIAKGQKEYHSVMGNHDYYHGVAPVPLEGCFDAGWIAGATMWTPMTISDYSLYRSEMNDVRMIAGLYHDTYNQLHEADIEFLRQTRPQVVVTHHAPSMNSIHPKYLGSKINRFFASNMEWLVQELQPQLWVHGHVHDSFDYYIGKTRVVCNPRGYKGEANFSNYQPLRITIEV